MTRHEGVNKNGSKEVTTHRYTPGGQERGTEIVRHGIGGRPISKTVTMRQPVVLTHRTGPRGTTLVKNYDHGRYGFVYHPGQAQRASLQAFRHDTYWHRPDGMMYHHPFHYAWNWNQSAWYRANASYFPLYDVYPTPVHWITDWMVGSYVAESYDNESAASEEPATTVVVARPYATPISTALKEELRVQVENTITKAERQEQGVNNAPVIPDLTLALANPNYIYPVSGTLSATLADDDSQSVIVTDGDLLKLVPGQDSILASGDENTLVTMRVMTSKGEAGEARAGTLISIPLKSLQDFDSEFRSRIDQGLEEAVANKSLFNGSAE